VYATAWALKGLWETLKQEGTTKSFTDRMICFDDFNTLIGLDKIRELESYYYRDLFESLQKQNN
jgi:DNA-binding MltR family transcriptional regulator